MESKSLILNYIPGLDSDEIAGVMAEYEADSTTTVCEYCRVKLAEEDMEDHVISFGDWYDPPEVAYSCPNCHEEEPALEKPTLEEWLKIETL